MLPVYTRFLQKLSGKKPAESSLVSDALLPSASASMHHFMCVDGDEENDQEHGHGHEPWATLPLTVPEESVTNTSVDLAKINAKDREHTFKWLQGDPLAELMLVAITLEPLQHLLNQHFAHASEEFELQQRADMAKAMLKGERGARVYRIQVASKGTLEKQFLEKVHRLQTETALWKQFLTKHSHLNSKVWLLGA
eukprot:6479023-Amphidinium_carterae.2